MNNTMVLISGTSRGLGSALYKYFTSKGFTTYSINKNKIGNNNFLIDLTARNIDIPILESVFSKYKKIIFISNASIISPMGNFAEEGLKSCIEDSIYINYINPLNIIFSIISTKKKFIVINISSGAALSSNEGLSLYSSSKAAKHRFIDILKKENLSNKDALYIDNFDPGRMNTDMQKELLSFKNIPNKKYSLSDTENVAKKLFEIVNKAL